MGYYVDETKDEKEFRLWLERKFQDCPNDIEGALEEMGIVVEGALYYRKQIIHEILHDHFVEEKRSSTPIKLNPIDLISF